MSTPNVITWIDGKQYTVEPFSPPKPTLVIPATAKTSTILDNSKNWTQMKDGGTPGTVSSMSNKYISAAAGRQFTAVQKGKAGVRWSNSFGKDSAPTNFVYDLWYMSPDPTQQAQLELDMNHVLPNGNNVFLCLQANHNSGAWDYTLTPDGNCHWIPSNIKVDPTKWTPNVYKHLRLKTSHDANGIVTYEGVEDDGDYQLFDPSCKGLSSFRDGPNGWTPNAMLLNYQNNGATAAGTMNTFAKQLQIIYW